MNKLILLKSECVQNLKQSIKKNLDRYRSGDFTELLDTITVDIELDYEALKGIHFPAGDDLKDLENCVLIESACRNLTPFVARDERLWTYLCHGPLLEYGRKRWPVPVDDEKAINIIKTHYFASDKRILEARNSVSRLYWLAHMASRVKNIPLQETLSLILYKQDVRMNVIERPTILQVESILVAVIKSLRKSKSSDEKLFERANFRILQQRLNEYCGYTFVESLPPQKVQKLVNQMVAEILADYTEEA